MKKQAQIGGNGIWGGSEVKKAGGVSKNFRVHSIASKNHRVIKGLRRLQRRSYRDTSRLFLAEGMRVLQEAVGSGACLRQLAFAPERAEEVMVLLSGLRTVSEVYEIPEELMNQISDVVNSQGVIGAVEFIDRKPEEVLEGEGTVFMVADEVRDPGNLGAVIRVADAAGADGFFATKGSVDVYNPKVVRAAAGSHFHISLAKDADFRELCETAGKNGIRVYGLDSRGKTDYLDLDYSSPFMLVFGNEAFGIPREHRNFLDEVAYIRMPGRAESLNVACAASVVVFEALRQRRGKGSDE